eukprot:CAMPEP_0177666434 /NCGR_PEP_ID=MMETSP0447-20121125/21584_1 /TAXON_ID=0 /ORGANISM="Stygamoeba regulata, Strain BSH-02190019" /LENGTH=370 /DNA_ID=CAMNT_0019172591 /DNA_START=134 /DNA_END=1243 /DNA_ORIENTATION=-
MEVSSSNRFHLHDILNTEPSLAAFTAFCRVNHCSENLEFWLAVKQYKTLRDEDVLKSTAEEICKTFIDPDSPRMINIDERMRVQLQTQVKHKMVDETSFDTAHQTITWLMAEDLYPKFLQSDQFKAFAVGSGKKTEKRREKKAVKSGMIELWFVHVSTGEQPSRIQRLVRDGVDVNTREAETERTGMHIAANNGDIKIGQLLLSLKANINAQDSRKWTPLHEAAKAGRHRFVEWALANGADATVLTDTHTSALHYIMDHAAPKGEFAMDIRTTPLLERILQLMLKQGTNINKQTVFGESPLHHAARGEGVGNIPLLLEYGAAVNIVNRRGYAPIHYVTSVENEHYLKWLIEHGADADLKGKDGRSSRDLA